MKTKKFTLILITLIIFIIPLCTFKTTNIEIDSSPAEITHVTSTDVDFPIYSEGAVLMDSSTGKVLYGKNENEKQATYKPKKKQKEPCYVKHGS